MCGLPLALSIIVKFPVRVPVAVGVMVTLIAHVFDPAVDGRVFAPVGQVLVSAKSPEAAIELIVRGAFPVLVRVTGMDGLMVVTI